MNKNNNIENITKQQQEEIRHTAYNLYQLDWMQRHHYSLTDLFNNLDDIFHEVAEDSYNLDEGSFHGVVNLFHHQGFNGELYASYNEFLVQEYLEEEYMETLCDVCGDCVELKQLYRQDIESMNEDRIVNSLVFVKSIINEVLADNPYDSEDDDEVKPVETEEDKHAIQYYNKVKGLKNLINDFLREIDVPFA